MDVALTSMSISSRNAHEGASMKMLKNLKEQMQVQGDNMVEMIEESAISVKPSQANINNGVSLDVRI